MKRRSSILTGSARGCRAWLPALALLAGLLLQTANACQVCIPFPTKTLADRLLEADALVLAREDPQRPFHYVALETLKGDPGDTPIDAFLPSGARRMLAQFPQRHIRHWYLERPERSREELQEIVKALSVMAGAEVALREPVAAGYRALLETHPAMAPDVSRVLIAWHRWDFVEQIQGIREGMAGQAPLAAYALGLYLRLAAGAAPSGPALPGIVEAGQPPIGVER